MDDTLFWKYKLEEQNEMNHSEKHRISESLGDFKEGYIKILSLKRRFMQGDQYHHVLNTWKKELDAIFDLAERQLK
ncbi:MAG: hypothetical protein WC523_04275 [Patescibacteria group bacterium]